ncbi:polysaccharide deacetylase family protein [Caldicellulosiruptor naganoensis]|uniref:Polysaccharide deacetylase n=1 Tax=Caldicellulosiruptor naganoensis TaxID=29324 RepID=A0ABY7BJ33_9FIRM|nr:polysaccharide deacetylase family protein [Caldicellulosiruptor naganoensis]WAM32347.1 polysaccharide deacetylase [Caldicellulosiruptor naganoensis]
MKVKKFLAIILFFFIAFLIVKVVAIKTEQILTHIILNGQQCLTKEAKSSSIIISKNPQRVISLTKPSQKNIETVPKAVYPDDKSSNPINQKKDRPNTKKIVYLTIDDGPSYETPKILEILEKENIKATFFVVGYNCTKYTNFLKLISQKGHLIGNHSYSHNYKLIYKSFKNFVEDFNKAQDVIYKITGRKPKYYRFPGGSLNRVSSQIKEFLDKNKITYIDWNAITGDSAKNHQKLTYKEIIKMTFSTTKNKNEIVLLMHDSPTKKNVIEALPYIIKELKNQGYVFETVDKMPKPLQFKTKAASSH